MGQTSCHEVVRNDDDRHGDNRRDDTMAIIYGNVWYGVINHIIDFAVRGVSSLVEFVHDQVRHWLYIQITIDPKNSPRMKHAIYEEIQSQGLHMMSRELVMGDAGTDLEYMVSNGSYTIPYHGHNLYVDITDTKITVRMFHSPFRTVSAEKLGSLCREMYREHNQSSKILMFNTSVGDEWAHVMFREPRQVIPSNDTITSIMKDVEQFVMSEAEYRTLGHPHRRGYFFYGPSKTGKSMMAELIAMKHEMSVYMVQLNAKDMTDSCLINLVGQIPPKSIIMFDEIDRQLEAMKRNPTTLITIGGLLTAIDGPQRLASGCIVILTANTEHFLPHADETALLRDGRIDVSYHMTQQIGA